MTEDFAPTNLRSRLDELEAKISKARAALATQNAGEHIETELAAFSETLLSIRQSLDRESTVTELLHSKATAETDTLETALTHWLKSTDDAFNGPAKRNPSVSM